MLTAAILLLALAYVAKAAVGTLTHQAGNNVFEQWGPWFDARTSWKRKYQDYNASDLRPRFWLSTTVLVFVTDFWHAADSIYLTSYLAGAALLGCWLAQAGLLAWILALAAAKAGVAWCFSSATRPFG